MRLRLRAEACPEKLALGAYKPTQTLNPTENKACSTAC